MAKRLRAFFAKEGGQDLVEYTLLLSFLAVVICAILSTNFRILTEIWTAIDSYLQRGPR
jgi:Flp pilus assembly pilin Flp